MRILGILILIVLGYILWQYIELKQFRIRNYEMKSDKIKGDLRIVVLSDLHCHKYGREGQRLFTAIRQSRPDLIVIPGDLIVDREPDRYEFAADFIKNLQGICPIYFSRGNHESRVNHYKDSENWRRYHLVEEKMQQRGCHILENQTEKVKILGNTLSVSGLELDLPFYTKGIKVGMSEHTMEDYLGKEEQEQFHILLAHNPAFAEKYARWGADLTVCGHNHGGLICIPGIGSIISPQFELFPKYSAGFYEVEGRKVAVSRGLGTHTFHIRIFNRAEVLLITVHGKSLA